MVSGKPPRRSKTTEEPVIIDLKATEVATDKPSEQVKPAEEATASAPATSEPVTEALPSETESAVASEITEAADTPKEDKQNAAPETSVEPPSAEQEKPEDAQFGSRASDVSPQAPLPEQDKPAPERPPSTATSSLLAAGIAGGLIALIAAGSMQYAGILPASGAGAGAEKIEALSAEVETLKEAMAKAQPATADTSALEARLAKLENTQQQTQSAAIDPAIISALEAKIASANQATDQLKSEVAGRVQSLTSGQTELSDKLSTIQTKLDKPRDDIEVARAIAASALKTAADRGGPFLAELRTLGSIAPEDPAINALEPYAATGAVSRAELLQRFGNVADTILSAINQPAESANIGERLLASAMSIIKVRPVGNVAGDSPSAIVARIEDKIRNGDLKGASAEWETLPEAGRTVSESFKKALDARIAVEAQVSDALARSVAGRQG